VAVVPVLLAETPLTLGKMAAWAALALRLPSQALPLTMQAAVEGQRITPELVLLREDWVAVEPAHLLRLRQRQQTELLTVVAEAGAVAKLAQQAQAGLGL
jgi:hypothetical protein